jgi:hypothetical protein
MLILQQAQSEPGRRQGSTSAGLAELREELAGAPALSVAARKRLAELSQRLSRVQALGDEYAGISLSPMAAAAVAGHGATD